MRTQVFNKNDPRYTQQYHGVGNLPIDSQAWSVVRRSDKWLRQQLRRDFTAECRGIVERLKRKERASE